METFLRRKCQAPCLGPRLFPFNENGGRLTPIASSEVFSPVMRKKKMKIKTLLLTLLAVLWTVPAFADYTNIWATWMPEAASPVKHRIHEFHNLLLVIITTICVFVAGLLIYTVIRFRRKANPNPSRTTHNVTLEIVWTMIPVLILAVIMWESFPLMYYMDKTVKPDLTLKVTGYQWYWGYSYPDQEIEEFSLHLVPPEGKRDPKNDAAALRTE